MICLVVSFADPNQEKLIRSYFSLPINMTTSLANKSPMFIFHALFLFYNRQQNIFSHFYLFTFSTPILSQPRCILVEPSGIHYLLLPPLLPAGKNLCN